MSRMVQIDEWYLQDLADAIRMKTNSTDKMRLPDMAPAIDKIVVGGGGSGENDAVRQTYVNSTIINHSDRYTIVIPKEAEQVRQYSNYGNADVKAVELENHSAPNLTTIGDYAFAYCSNIKSIEWPENLQIIGANSFRTCSNLEDTELPDSLVTIKDSAFRN